MAPLRTTDEVRNLRLANPEFLSDIALAFTAGAGHTDSLYVGPGEFGVTVILASLNRPGIEALGVPRPACGATLLRHVGGILGGASEEQVVGADAKTVVAGMEDPKVSWRSDAICQLPRQSMGVDGAGMPIAQASITGSAAPSNPFPAACGLSYFGPEALGERNPFTRALVSNHDYIIQPSSSERNGARDAAAEPSGGDRV